MDSPCKRKYVEDEQNEEYSSVDLSLANSNDTVSHDSANNLEMRHTATSTVQRVADEDDVETDASTGIARESPIQSKRRKIHMDTMECFQHADSADGRKPLSNPSLQAVSLRRNLHPVIRRNRIKSEKDPEDQRQDAARGRNATDNPYARGFASSSQSQGFVSAADMYKIAGKSKFTGSASVASSPKAKNKASRITKSNANQRSILGFMKTSKESEKNGCSGTSMLANLKTEKDESNDKRDIGKVAVSCSQNQSPQRTSCSTMHSPIKRVGKSDVIYISDTDTSSPKFGIFKVSTDSQSSCASVKSSKMGSSSQPKDFGSFKVSADSQSSSASVKSPETGSSPQPDSSQNTKCMMYSPIKRIGQSNVIYISESSPSSSQGSSQNACVSKVSDVANNSTVKQLFSAQKNLGKEVAKKKVTRQKKASHNSRVVLGKKELGKIKTEAASYFENDSFDMNAVFDSDPEFSINCGKSTKSENKHKASDKYGLLGTGNYPKASPSTNNGDINYFDMLPPEVLEQIFCGLPMLDLCLNSNRVCTQWNAIIANEKFLPWKKLYHKLKKDLGTSRQEVQTTMRKHGMTSASNFLVGLIRYMKDFKPVTASNMLECLQKHSRYRWARDLIQERLPDCIVNEEPSPWCMMTTLVIVSDDVYSIQEMIACLMEPSPWCVMTTLVIVSDDVYSIQEMIACLTVATSQCTTVEIVECLYCVATFLYAFRLAKRADVWNGMHYRLFYALYLYENASSSSVADLHGVTSSSKGQQSLVKYSSSSESVRLTHEQLRIVKHQTTPCEVIKIVAFAGTGKTTTLVKYTQLRPDKKFLLVVYNKSVCEYAKTKFPQNVVCKTGHALAFQVFGRRYQMKLFGIKVYSLTQALTARKGENLFIQAKNVLSTLENYFASADRQISMQHVPNERLDDRTGLKVPIAPSAKNLYVQDAVYIWGRMQDFNDKKIGMTHDGYLKLYQLSRPSLRQYDCILIDEAQDLTPAITDILLHQSQGKILVGDPHQQIYSFRGAINAMDTITADTIFYLTQSFRFGPEIALVAAHCLDILKHEKKKTLVGSGKKCTVMGEKVRQLAIISRCTVMGEKVGQLAIISRCNFTVFSEAVKKCCYSDEQCRVAFVGGTGNFGFPMMMDMYTLTLSKEDREKDGYEIQSKLIKMFSTFAALENFATKSLDTELLGKIKIVKTYHHNLPLLIRKIESKCVRDERQADYVFSTAHKAKGLEFSTVRVTDDFLMEFQPSRSMGPILFDEDEDIECVRLPHIKLGENNMDEGNLLYVAVTRAKNALQMSSTLLRILKQAGEKFEFPVYSEDLRLAGTTFKCKETDQEFKPTALTLECRSIKRGDGVEIPGCVYSPAYLSEDFGSFSGLLGLTKTADDLSEKKKLPSDSGT